METVLSLSTVPLKQLRLSPLNVRKQIVQDDVDELAASIAAHGLRQNLVVVPGAEPDTFEVVAGGLRFRALKKLLDAFAVPDDMPIAVAIEEGEQAREVSLAENVERFAMNPVDELEAYAQVVADHAAENDPIGYCARRFGKTRHYVAGRLRLAELAPEILQALRNDKIPLEAAKAYASVGDHALQAAVFAAEERRMFASKHNPREIRDALKMKTLPASCAQARYVGMEAYLAAGGRASADLFMGVEEGERLLDPGILDQLVRAKAEEDVIGAARRDGFGSSLLTKGLTGSNPAWPPTPAGFIRSVPSKTLKDLPKKQRKDACGVYSIAAHGEHLECVGWFLRPAAAATPIAEDEPPAPLPVALPMGPAMAPPQQEDPRTAADDDRRARRRESMVRFAAARIAVERVAGDILQGNAFWPAEGSYVPPIVEEADDMVVAVLFRIPRADVDALLPEAEQQVAALGEPA